MLESSQKVMAALRSRLGVMVTKPCLLVPPKTLRQAGRQYTSMTLCQSKAHPVTLVQVRSEVP